MRGFLNKFKTVHFDAKSRVATLIARWRFLFYSAPVLALFFPNIAHAGIGATAGKFAGKAGSAITGAVGNIIGTGVETAGSLMVWLFVVYQLSKIFADLFSGIFLFLINFLIGVSQYNSFLGSQIVTIGWTVTRDIANMFLVVALLVIAFATILNINSYQASALLKDFFFAAILVNFSKMICGVLIDAAQVVMMTFVSGYSETAAGNFVKLFKIDQWLQLALGTASSQLAGAGIQTETAGAGAIKLAAGAAAAIGSSAANFFSGIATNIFTSIIGFIGILAVLSLDIILVVRIVTLWFLIVASPIAFVAKVLPVTKGFSSQWWSAFNKQLIAGPLVAFIVWISLASIAVSDNAFDLTKEAQQGNKLFAESNAATQEQGQVAATKISQWENLALYFIPIVIFIMGAKWAVGVAGGAAKSITGFASGKLSGLARSGLSTLKNQAVGKGQFSVLTQAKKGFSGQGGFTSGLLGGTVGALGTAGMANLGNRFGALKEGTKLGDGIRTAGSALIGGAESRARTRELQKDVKNAASHLGVGELGKKRVDVVNAGAEADMYRKRASKERAADMAAARSIADPATREKAENEAQSNYATLQKKADEAIHHAEEAQKDIFKADGRIDDGVLLADMKKKVENGTVNEVELAAAKKMIGESVDKKVTDEIAKKRQAWAKDRKAHVDAGGDPEDFRKFDEAAVRGEAENEFGIKKKNEGDPTNPGIEDLYKSYKQAPPRNITDDKSKTPTKVAAEAAKTATTAAGSILAAANVSVANGYARDMATPGNADVARNNLAASTGAALQAAKTGGASDADLKAAVGRAINMVPSAGRAAFTNDLTSAAGSSAVGAIVAAVRSELSSISPATATNEILDRLGKRVEGKPSETTQITLKDLGSRTSSDGRQTLSPDAVGKLAAAIAADPKFVARLSPQALMHPDIQRTVGHSVQSSGDALDIMMEIGSTLEKSVGKTLARNLATAIKNYHPDPVMKAQADSLPGLI